MEYKWIGAALIIFGCGGFGFSLAAAHIREEQLLRQLAAALDFMQCELQYRLTPLPDLCRIAGQQSKGEIREILLRFSDALNDQLSPDAGSSMEAAISRGQALPERSARNLRLLGSSLGRFDLEGQLDGLEAVRSSCRKDLESLSHNRENRLRSYQTLGLCAGAALAILLI